MPPPADVDYPFGSYHSKTEVQGKTLVYTRTFEIKEVSVPLDKIDDLKKFYRIIGSDERGTPPYSKPRTRNRRTHRQRSRPIYHRGQTNVIAEGGRSALQR